MRKIDKAFKVCQMLVAWKYCFHVLDHFIGIAPPSKWMPLSIIQPVLFEIEMVVCFGKNPSEWKIIHSQGACHLIL